MAICSNCQTDVKPSLFLPTLGICHACRVYERRTGRKRAGPSFMAGGASGICRNCNQSPAQARGLCNSCYKFQRLTGKPRPRKYWARREACKNCGLPREGTRRGKLTRGMCDTCDKYRQRTGRNRPAHLWKAPLGWCDCGHRATHANVPLRIGTGEGYEYDATYNLCDDCYALENEPVK